MSDARGAETIDLEGLPPVVFWQFFWQWFSRLLAVLLAAKLPIFHERRLFQTDPRLQSTADS